MLVTSVCRLRGLRPMLSTLTLAMPWMEITDIADIPTAIALRLGKVGSCRLAKRLGDFRGIWGLGRCFCRRPNTANKQQQQKKKENKQNHKFCQQSKTIGYHFDYFRLNKTTMFWSIILHQLLMQNYLQILFSTITSLNTSFFWTHRQNTFIFGS